MTWWRRLRRRAQLDRELDAEIQDHCDRHMQDLLDRGLSASEARRRARLEFGGSDQVKEYCRDVWGTQWMEHIALDVRYAMRLFAKERWFTLAAVGALGLGIAATSTIATVINGYYFRGLPVTAPERILAVGTRDRIGRAHGVSHPEYEEWQTASRTFVELAAFTGATMTVSDPGTAPESLAGAYLSSNAFSILEAQPLLGRRFLSTDDRPGARRSSSSDTVSG